MKLPSGPLHGRKLIVSVRISSIEGKAYLTGTVTLKYCRKKKMEETECEVRVQDI